MSHTPVPWVVTRDGYRIMQDHPSSCKVIAVLAHNKQERNPEARANASHIVLCVNSHDEMLEACKNTLEDIEEALRLGSPASLHQIEAWLSAVIAKAEGRS